MKLYWRNKHLGNWYTCCILPIPQFTRPEKRRASGQLFNSLSQFGLRPLRLDRLHNCPSQFGIYGKSSRCILNECNCPVKLIRFVIQIMFLNLLHLKGAEQFCTVVETVAKLLCFFVLRWSHWFAGWSVWYRRFLLLCIVAKFFPERKRSVGVFADVGCRWLVRFVSESRTAFFYCPARRLQSAVLFALSGRWFWRSLRG